MAAACSGKRKESAHERCRKNRAPEVGYAPGDREEHARAAGSAPGGDPGRRRRRGRQASGADPGAAPAAKRSLLPRPAGARGRSEEHTSELQSLRRISYAVFCLKKKK